METVKEKLITLLKAADKYAFIKCAEHGSCDECDKLNKGCVNEEKAHYLIQNGVTILECGMDCKNCWKTKLVNPAQEWVSVDERLPEESLNSVLGWDEYRERCVFVQYNKGEWILGNHESVKITHWMPLPQPPKGVQ